MDADLAAIAQAVRIDAMTADVVTALRAAGVEPVLLKGPVIAERLYAGRGRGYVDADLLVAPRDHERAEGVLGRLGFERQAREWEDPDRMEHDAPWRRPQDAMAIDLHRTLPGARAVSPQELWRRIEPHLTPWTIPDARVPVRVLDDPGLALLVALHAAHHLREGVDARRPLADVSRAVERLPVADWEAAARLAAALRSGAEMARGLHAAPGGAELAARLALPAPATGHEGAFGFERLARTRGTLARARVLARALAPPPSYLRWTSPLARRGPGGLVLAYLSRPFALAAYAARAILRRR
jgi:hypothetical protein